VDLTSPLRSLAPGLDSAVLEVLAQTESGMGVSQIAKLAGRGTRQGLSPVLDRLVEHGVVLADPGVRGSMYRLNRDHVLAESVLSAARARITILTRLAEAVQALAPPPVHVSVFGSFARREAGPGSDIDVLVVLPANVEADEHWSAQMRHLGNQVQAWTGNRMEHLTLTEDELRAAVERHERVVDEWQADSVTILGRPFEAVLTHLGVADRGHA
jgi:predicted nucleotidyltransferase